MRFERFVEFWLFLGGFAYQTVVKFLKLFSPRIINKKGKRIQRIFDKKIRHQFVDICFDTTDRNVFYVYNPRSIVKIDISKVIFYIFLLCN